MVTFNGDLVVSVHSYQDDLALLEQLITYADVDMVFGAVTTELHGAWRDRSGRISLATITRGG